MRRSAETKSNRRELLGRGIPALAGYTLYPSIGLSAERDGTAAEGAEPVVPWPQRRKEMERAWLDLLGDFPTAIPPLHPEMKKVAVEEGITRYHVSFQT